MFTPKYYKQVYKSREELPQEQLAAMRYGFVVKYGDDIVTGWCESFSGVLYSASGMVDNEHVGLKLNNVIINLDSEVFYSHSFITVVGTPVMFFPKEEEPVSPE